MTYGTAEAAPFQSKTWLKIISRFYDSKTHSLCNADGIGDLFLLQRSPTSPAGSCAAIEYFQQPSSNSHPGSHSNTRAIPADFE